MGLLAFTNEIYTYLLKTPAACCEIHFCLFQSKFWIFGGFSLNVHFSPVKNRNYMHSGDKMRGPTCYFAGKLLTLWDLVAFPHPV